MDSLLAAVLDAHGGLQNWKCVTRLTAKMSLGGPFWAARGWPNIYSDQLVTLDPHREHITFSPFVKSNQMSVFHVAPERLALTTLDGRLVEERVDPRNTFPRNFVAESTPWDAIQVAYFTSAAVWNYLTAPFVFSFPGVEAHEISPWLEPGEGRWRRLAVTFPKSIANHNADQVFYYDDDLLLRRMDYSPDVTSNPPVAHYTYNHKTFGGFVFPTRRHVKLHDAGGVANQHFTAISIDLYSVAIDRD